MRRLFKTSVSIISSVVTTKSRWIFITVKSFKRFSLVVFLRYVFKRRNEEENLSLLAVVTDNVINICKSRWTVGIMSSLQSKKASVAFLGFLFFIRWYHIANSPIADISSASIFEEYVFLSSLNSVSFFFHLQFLNK